MTPARAEAIPRDVREGGSWTWPQRLKNDGLFALITLVLAVVQRLPNAWLRPLCRSLGLAIHALSPGLRARVRRRLALGIGAEPESGRVRAAFRATAEALADTVALLDAREPAGRRLRLDDGSRRVFREALDEGHGVVFVTAHLGPWERMAAVLVEEGFPVATVARESYDPRLTRAVYDRLREPRGVRAIYRGQRSATGRIVRELSGGGAVGFLVDLPSRRVRSVDVVLFGREHAFPIGPARIALGRRAAVVVGTCAGGVVAIERIATRDLERSDALVLVERLTRAIERRVAAHPEEWAGLFT